MLLCQISDKNYLSSSLFQAIAQKAGYSSGLVEHIVISDDPKYLGSANLVIYGSFLEEQSFPSILKHAMCLGKLIVAPDLDMIRKYVISVDAHFFLNWFQNPTIFKQNLISVLIISP